MLPLLVDVFMDYDKSLQTTADTGNTKMEGVFEKSTAATDARGNARTQNYSFPVGPAQKTYEYDLNGNLLREKDPVGTIIRSFEWDAADRMKAIVSGSQRIEWTYNSQGQKVLETANGTARKRYLWDGSSLLLERTPTGVISKRFYADGEQRVGGTDAGNYYYTRDHLGSVCEVVNQAGALVARYDYDAYGKRSTLFQSPSYSNGSPFGYTGHLTVPSLTPSQSELVLTHFRAYDPQLGRWLSPDPIGEAGGMNLYGYVDNDPVNNADEFGLQRGPGRVIRGVGSRVGPIGSRTNPFVFTRGAGPSQPNPYAPPRRATERCNQVNNIQRTMEYAQGNQGNQRVFTPGEVIYMAMRWLGPGARVTSRGDAMISLDGTRVWRPPTMKPNSPHAKTGVQSNFMRRDSSNGQTLSNYHVNVCGE